STPSTFRRNRGWLSVPSRSPASHVARRLPAGAAAAAPGYAARRARLSADLADHLSHGSQSIDVIVSGDPASVEALAARYNLVLKRRLKSGGVLRVNAGQLDAVAADGQFDHLSGDIPIKSSMAI